MVRKWSVTFDNWMKNIFFQDFNKKVWILWKIFRTMRSSVSVILSSAPPDTTMSFPDYLQTAADHATLLILVRHVGKNWNIFKNQLKIERILEKGKSVKVWKFWERRSFEKKKDGEKFYYPPIKSFVSTENWRMKSK